MSATASVAQITNKPTGWFTRRSCFVTPVHAFVALNPWFNQWFYKLFWAKQTVIGGIRTNLIQSGGGLNSFWPLPSRSNVRQTSHIFRCSVHFCFCYHCNEWNGMEKVLSKVPVSEPFQGCTDYHFVMVIHKTLFMGFCKNSILVENGNIKNLFRLVF